MIRISRLTFYNFILKHTGRETGQRRRRRMSQWSSRKVWDNSWHESSFWEWDHGYAQDDRIRKSLIVGS